MNSIPLRFKFLMLPTVLVLALAATCFVVIDSIKLQHEDGILLGVAGRQRMLNQRFITDTLRAVYSEGETRQQAIDDGERSVNLFRSTLQSLRNGGTVALNSASGKTAEISPRFSSEVISILELNSQLVSQLVKEAAILIESSANGGTVDTAVFLDLSSQLFTEANNVVRALSVSGDENVSKLVRNCLWISGIAAVLSLFLSWRICNSIVVPVMRCRKALKRMASGDLSRPYNMKRGDEFGDIVRDLDVSVQAMSSALGSERVDWEEVGLFFRDLKMELQQVRAIITQSRVPMMLVGHEACITFANPAAVDELKRLHRQGHLPVLLECGSDLATAGGAMAEVARLAGDHDNLPHCAQVSIDSQRFQVDIEPIHSDNGAQALALLSWKNITAELATQDDLATKNEAAAQYTRSLNTLVDQISRVMQAASSGDLSQHVDPSDNASLNAIAETINGFLDILNRDFGSMQEHIGELAIHATGLRNSSSRIRGSVGESNEQCVKAVENAQSVSGLMRDASATTEAMTSSINEIYDSTSRADKVSRDAVVLASGTHETIQQLGDSSSGIGSVLKMITSIAEQTNLLALNATIEAARAGEAGKGFAVVASEVKELAKQTANATEEIGSRIGSIQADSGSAVKAISGIHTIIHEISEYQTSVASAMLQQRSASREMSEMVQCTADTSGSMNQGLQLLLEKSTYSFDIARNCLVVSEDLESRTRTLQSLLARYQLRSS